MVLTVTAVATPPPQQAIVKFGDPQFLTSKMRIRHLANTGTDTDSSNCSSSIYDFQLRDHFLNASNLNVLQCDCTNHKHNKEPCRIVYEPICNKCKTPTRLLTTFQSLLFHPKLATQALTKCCSHEHNPPCERCINCKTFQPCIVTEKFECSTSTGKHYFFEDFFVYFVYFFCLCVIFRCRLSLGSKSFYD